MATPPTDPSQPSPKPPGGMPPGARPPGPAPSQEAQSPQDQKYAFLLNSPFAKMFKASGATPTVQEMKGIIDSILNQQIITIKQEQASWKKAMRKMKEAIEGND